MIFLQRGGVLLAHFPELTSIANLIAVQGTAGVSEHSLLTALRIPPERTARASQVHGTRVVAIDRPGTVSDCDGLATDTPGVLLLIRVADCVPIFLVDPRSRAIALAHAGWRGTLRGIASEAVGVLRRTYGIRAEDLIAALGPSIAPCCYEVGEDVAEQCDPRWLRASKTRGRPRLNLVQANVDILRRSGLPDKSILTARLCTSCFGGLFPSYRRDGAGAGRMIAALGYTDGDV